LQPASWSAHTPQNSLHGAVLNTVLSPLEHSPMFRPDQAPEPAHEQHMSGPMEDWAAVGAEIAQSTWSMFPDGFIPQPSHVADFQHWDANSSPQYIAPERLQQDRRPFPDLYSTRHMLELDSTPISTVVASALVSSSAVSRRRPPIPTVKDAVPPAEAEDALMLLEVPRDASANPSPAESLECKVCGQKFQGNAVRRLLRRHLQRHNPSEVVFVCNSPTGDGTRCQRCYNREDNLVQHRRKKGHRRIGEQIKRLRQRHHRSRGGARSKDDGVFERPSPSPSLEELGPPLHRR